jgi:hypothetical protein
VKAVESRVDAVPGRTLIIPVTLEGGIDPRKPVRAKLDDGRTVAAPLYWVSATLPVERGAWSSWLDPAGVWAATAVASNAQPSGLGWWVVAVDMPLNAIGEGLWLNDDRVAVNWMGDPAAALGAPIVWRPVDEAVQSAALLKLADPERQSPVRRWRYRLLKLGPQGLTWGMEGESPPGLYGEDAAPFENPVLEAMARQDEARWAAALGWLWVADADLAERVRRTLVCAVDFSNGVMAPAWPTRVEDLESLRSDLLNPRLGNRARADRAIAWLDAQTPAAAWVVDDAGARGPDGRALATVAVANLTERPTLAWVSAVGSGQSPDLQPVPSLGVRRITAGSAGRTIEERVARPRIKPERLEVHAGKWAAEREALLEALPVSPPGLSMEPLVGDWTMGSLLAGEPGAAMAPEPMWATAAVLGQRAEGEVGNDETGASKWWLYIECKSPPGEDGSSPASDETVRVWVGPPGRPTAVLRISSRGTAVDERVLERASGGSSVPGVRVTREADRWVCQAPLPRGVVEEDGTVRIGIERTDARGKRCAWPRPMTPWQVEPGRARVDTGAWGGVGGGVGKGAVR